MRTILLPLLALLSLTSALDKPLNIEVTQPATCDRKSAKGDKIEVHYRGTLEADGSEFDASYNRGQPLGFHLGKGQVIKGRISPSRA
jgi:FK506-binding protein 2